MKISQREARRLRKRVYELEQQESQRRNSWVAEWPNSIHVANIPGDKVDRSIGAAIRTARKLRHAVVVTCKDDDTLNFHAINLA